MPRKEFEQVVAQASREELTVVASYKSTSLASGQNEVVQTFAPKGMIGKVIGLRIDIPAIASAIGNHKLYIRYDIPDQSQNIDLVYVDAVATNLMVWRYGRLHYTAGYTDYFPVDETAQILLGQNLQFDSEKPFTISYNNGSDLAQTGERIYQFTVLLRQIAE
jgi:hypothetical protein